MSAKEAIRAHCTIGLAAFESVFGESVFPPAIHTHAAPSMKIEDLNEEDRTEIAAAERHLGNCIILMQAAGEELDRGEKEAAKVQSELATAKARRDKSREAAETINTLTTQAKLIAQSQEEAAKDFTRWHRSTALAVRTTVDLMQEISAQLFDQLRAEVSAALAPFYRSIPTGTVDNLFQHNMDAFLALNAFRHRGQTVTQHSAADEVLTTAKQLRTTLQNILQGKDVFTFEAGHA